MKTLFRSGRLTAAISMLLAGAATAQTAPSTPGVLEEIIVTAQKREQKLSDVPIALQAFTGESLRETGAAELSDLLRQVPGASEGISNSYGFKNYQIRGTGAVTGDATVAYYLDDAAFSLISSNIAPVARTFDVDRVEILRGPQGTLYGLSALGGAVRFITAEPDLQNLQVRSQAGYSYADGGEQGYFVDGALSVPIVEGKLAARAVVDYEHKGGYVEVLDFPNKEDLDPTDILNYRGKLLWQPSEAFEVSVTIQHNEVDQDFGTLLIDNDPPTGVQGTDAGLAAIETKYDMASAALRWDLGFAALESTTGWLEFNLDQTAFLDIGGPTSASQTAEQPTFTQELRLVSATGGNVDWVVGAFYKDAENDSTFTLTGPVVNLEVASTSTSETIAAFAELSANLLEGRLVPLIGVRYSEDERTLQSGGAQQKDTFDAFDPRFNLSYRTAANHLYYLNIARADRSGLFNNPALVPIAQSLGIPAEETVAGDFLWSYELGTKGGLFDNRLAYDIAVYHTDWQDVQLIVTPLPGLGVTINAGSAKGEGIDYGFTFQVTPALSVSLTGNWNDTTLEELPSSIEDASPSDALYEGARMPYVPKSTTAVTTSLDLPINAEWNFNGYLAWSHQSGQFQINSGLTSDEIDMISARLGVRRDRLAITLFSDNLGNEDGRTYREFGLINRPYPRTIGLQLSYDY